MRKSILFLIYTQFLKMAQCVGLDQSEGVRDHLGLSLLLFFFSALHLACRIKPSHPAVEAQSPNDWITRKVLQSAFLTEISGNSLFSGLTWQIWQSINSPHPQHINTYFHSNSLEHAVCQIFGLMLSSSNYLPLENISVKYFFTSVPCKAEM